MSVFDVLREENCHCKVQSEAASVTKYFRMIDIGEDGMVTANRCNMIVQIAPGQFGFMKIAQQDGGRIFILREPVWKSGSVWLLDIIHT